MHYWDADQVAQKNSKRAWIITLIINVLILIALYFIVVWKAPIPPLPSFGLELNLGFSPTGSGDRISTTPPAAEVSEQIETAAPGELSQNPVPEASAETALTTEQASPKTQPQPVSPEAVSKNPSPINGQKPKDEALDPNQQNPKDSSKASPDVAASDAQKTVQKAAEKPTLNEKALMGAEGTKGEGSQVNAGGAQGVSNQKGDAGDPEGTLEGRALLGKGSGKGQATGSGYSLDLAGWDFADKPNISDRVSSRNGKIVFQITVNDAGKVVQAIPLEYNVSNEVLAYYRQVVNQVSFRQQGGEVPDFSTGNITFIIKVD